MSTDGKTLVFADEFDSLGLRADGGVWSTTFHDGQRTHTSTGERQIYVDADYVTAGGVRPGIDPFAVEDGILTISADRTPADLLPALGGFPYTSGLLTTYDTLSFQYGYLEISAQVPAGQGLWPALWMLRRDYGFTGEIDIMEVLGHDTDFLNSTAHVLENGVRNTIKIVRETVDDLAAGFHTYGLDWTEQRITISLDGTELGSVPTPDDLKRPMYLLMNLAVGGNWPGNPDASTPFPAEYKIDYVRLWQDQSPPPPDFNVIGGTAGNDRLNGTAGADQMFAYRGDDTLYGGAGNDELFGQIGRDVFVWRPGADTDVVGDFTPADDFVLVEGAGFASGADVLRAIRQVGDDAVLDMGGGEALILNNTALSSLRGIHFRTGGNHAPVVATAIPDQSADAGAVRTYRVPATTFTDADGDALTYSARLQDGSALPGWITFAPSTRTFTIRPSAADGGTAVDIAVTARDGHGGSATDVFRLSVEGPENHAPVVSRAIPDQTVAVGRTLDYQIRSNSFTDPDGDALTYAAALADGSALPDWITFDPATRIIRAEPTRDEAGSAVSISVTAADGRGGAVSDAFQITVTGVRNHDPLLRREIPDQTVAAGRTQSFEFRANSFSDADGDALTYAALLADGSALPDWLDFDADGRTFTARPAAGDGGTTLQVTVTADDGYGGTATDTFALSVQGAAGQRAAADAELAGLWGVP